MKKVGSMLLCAMIVAGLAVMIGSVVEKSEAQGGGDVLASWYGPGFEGNFTASGDVFEPWAERTAASPHAEFGSTWEVCHEGCTEVEITDRGPHGTAAGLDLAALPASEIGLMEKGVAPVSMRRTG